MGLTIDTWSCNDQVSMMQRLFSCTHGFGGLDVDGFGCLDGLHDLMVCMISWL